MSARTGGRLASEGTGGQATGGTQRGSTGGRAASGTRRPAFRTPDQTIWEMRASDKSRVFWYREEGVMNILWFDPQHDGTGR